MIFAIEMIFTIFSYLSFMVRNVLFPGEIIMNQIILMSNTTICCTSPYELKP